MAMGARGSERTGLEQERIDSEKVAVWNMPAEKGAERTQSLQGSVLPLGCTGRACWTAECAGGPGYRENAG